MTKPRMNHLTKGLPAEVEQLWETSPVQGCNVLRDALPFPLLVLIRSGCYITHDHGYYAEKMAEAQARSETENGFPSFEPALELWAAVQSLPKQGQAIITFGKRDCPYDLGLPKPLYAVPEGKSLESLQSLAAGRITDTNDQHAFLSYPESVSLHVGDRVVCGISHPCTAFDKWRMIPLVDDDYNVIDWYRTYF